MKKRRIVTVAMAGMMTLAAVGTLAGCGGSAEGVIKVAFAETGNGRAHMEQWEAEFEALNPGVDVVLEGQPGMTAEVENRLRTNTDLPDVFIVLEMGWQKLAAEGFLEPLDDVYAAPADETGVTIGEFINPNIKDYGKMTLQETHHYVIPVSDGPTGIVYNRGMFEQYGWQVPETVDDLMALCDQIIADTNKTVKPFAFLPAYSNYIVDTWWAQYEGEAFFNRFFKYEKEEVYVQQGRVEALRAFENLFFDGKKQKNSVFGIASHTDAQGAFARGEAAMIIEGSWMENEAKNTIGEGFDMCMMPTPFVNGAFKDADGNYKSILASQAGDFMCVPKEAENVTGGIEFLKYINSRKGCESYTKALNGALRPFQYKASEVEGVTASSFMQSCWEVYENTSPVYHYSNNPMSWSNKLGIWPGVGVPYEGMLKGLYYESAEEGQDQAAVVCQACYDHVCREWGNIMAEWQ